MMGAASRGPHHFLLLRTVGREALLRVHARTPTGYARALPVLAALEGVYGKTYLKLLENALNDAGETVSDGI